MAFVKCKECNKSFKVTPSRADKAKFCSRKCWYKSPKKINKITLKCLCGKSFEAWPCDVKNGRKYCSAKCRPFFKGPQAFAWKGGRIKRHKYWYTYTPNHSRASKEGYVREHIVICEKLLKRSLKKGETPHHLNHNSLDNKPENLYLFPTPNAHNKYHMDLRYNNCKRIVKSNLVH